MIVTDLPQENTTPMDFPQEVRTQEDFLQEDSTQEDLPQEEVVSFAFTQRTERRRVESRFVIPVITYDSTLQSYVKVEEYDATLHGARNELCHLFAVCWTNTNKVPPFRHSDYVQTTVSYTTTCDVVGAAANLNTARRCTPAEEASRRQRGLTPSHYVGCPSIIEFREI